MEESDPSVSSRQLAFILGQYRKAPLFQKSFLYYNCLAVAVLIFVGAYSAVLQNERAQSAVASGALDADADGDGDQDYVANAHVLVTRNVLFGIAFGYFGVSAILFENIYELVVWLVMTLVFEIVTLAACNHIWKRTLPLSVPASVISAANILFFIFLRRTLGRNSSLLFYSAGSNVAHRAAYNQYLIFNAVMKMDLFITFNLYFNILVYSYGGTVRQIICPCFFYDGGSCPSSYPTNSTGMAILTILLFISYGWNFLCIVAIRREYKVGTILLAFLGFVVPVLGAIAFVNRLKLCGDTPFISSLLGLTLVRCVLFFLIVRCVINFNKGLLDVFARRSNIGRPTQESSDIRIDFNDVAALQLKVKVGTEANASDENGSHKKEEEDIADKMSEEEMEKLLQKENFSEMETASSTECAYCTNKIAEGTSGYWQRGVGVLHKKCAVKFILSKSKQTPADVRVDIS